MQENRTNTSRGCKYEIGWACTFNESGDAGCQFTSADEGGFSANLSGEGDVRERETPGVMMPPGGPDVTIIALMGLRTGILCGKHVGVTAEHLASS